MRMALLGMALLATPVAAQPVDRSRAVVQRYYAAIDHGDYRTAYALWQGANPQPYPAFVRGFARTARTRVVADAPTDQEGAAGSTYITVPVRVYATLKNGAHQRFSGAYVLRRVNGVPGATPAQLRWHIDSAKLRVVG